MPHRTFALASVVAVVLSSSLSGQQHPDFSGNWQATKDAPPAGIAAAPTPVFGERFALKQSASTLELFRTVRGRTEPFVTTHSLDGAQTRVMLPARTCLGQTGQVITTAWNGSAIDYAIVGSLAPGSTTPTASGLKYSFKREGADTLIVQTTMRTAAAAEPTAVATVYKKSADPLPASEAPKPKPTQATIAQVEWIAGTWTGTLGTAALEERWLSPAGGSMLATSRTMRNGAMTEFEFLCISERDGGLVYSAMPNAGALTDFVMTKIDADSATFENPAHDFPKMIRYARKPDGSLEATISGAAGSRPTTFVFKKQ